MRRIYIPGQASGYEEKRKLGHVDGGYDTQMIDR